MRLKMMLVILLLAFSQIGRAADFEPGSPGLGDPYYPLLGNGGYDVQHYTIELTVDVEGNTLSGSTTIEAQATQDLSAFNLDLNGLDVSAITVNDASARFSRKDTELTITPSTPLSDGDSFTAVVDYSGTPQPVRDASVPFSGLGWLHFPSGIYILGEPSGAMSWFPCNNHPLDKATFDFRITVPQPYTVAANGLLQGTVTQGTQTTYLWKTSNPVATYLAAIYIAEFQKVTSVGPNGLPIRNYFPLSAPDSMTTDVENTPDMIAYFSDLFGPYPFEAYGVAVLDIPAIGIGMENQTLSAFDPRVIDDELSVAHELAHQWFGDSISLKSWKDIWLNEGFAQYMQALWLEHTQGEAAFQRYMDSYYSSLSRSPFVPPGDPGLKELFGLSVYLRGAWTLHALRLKVGDEIFFNILKTYYTRFEYSNASSADFIAVAEEVSGQKLGDFFNAWLYEKDLPEKPSPNIT